MADPSDVEPIAIIGMGCRLPGNVGSAEDLWKLVSTGGSGWKLVPSDRWTRDAFYHPDKASRQAYNAVSGYFLDQDISHYDSRFFGFSSAEANMTDPQQRILLETAYEALENAGIPMESLKGSDTAVFAALFARDYDRMGYKDLDTLSGLHIGGAGEAIIANRISHFFDLRGTSMTIDTGCSGSLVALHEACICLRAGQSRMAIVGGTEILLHPDQNISMSTAGMLNDDGKSYTFDSRGSGYGRGEGVAAVVVKRLRDALEDGDTIHSVIRISGSNQDGKTNGVTLPSPEAQEALMRQVYKNAGLDPHETLYVEAHGTGTVAGDHAEAKSLSRVFCEKKRPRNLWVGSVKTNMGHLEAASGLAGLIKAVMVLKNQQIPPNLNYIEPKPGLMLDERQLQVPLELLPLIPEGEKGAVRVSVNSFGYGGTNCHIILESLEQFKTSGSRFLPTSNGVNGHKVNGVNGVNGTNGHHVTNGTNGTNGVHESNSVNGTNGTNGTNGHVAEDTVVPEKLPLVFPISASSEATLEAMPGMISEWLGSREVSEADLRQLSYTLSCRRSLLKWRKTFLASDLEKLQASLDEKVVKTRSAPSAKIAFVFTGQGAQWAGMGRDLVSSSKTFRTSIESSSRILKDLGCEWDLLEELSKPAKESRINESELAQPLTTIVQMAIVDLLADMDIKPQFVVGHSSGEIAASYAAGALSHENAIKGSFFRGRYSKVAKKLNSLPGSMLATGYSEQAALQSIKAANIGPEKGRVVVACVNSPESVTLSGDEPAVDIIQDMISNVGIFARKLVVESAYHSHHMEKVADAYSESIGDLAPSDVREGIEFMSSVTGSPKTTGFGSDYWVKNLVSQVRFNDAVNALAVRMSETGATDAANIFVEIGPHAALQGPLKQILGGIPGFKHSYVAPLLRGKSSSETFMTAAGRLFELGAELNWQSLFSAKDKRVIEDLRPYPWDHRVQHWSESRLSRDHRLRQFPYHDLLGLFDVMSPVDEPRWRFYVSVDRMPWIKDHVVDGMVIFPGAGYSAMGVEALKQLTKMQNPDAKITKTIFRNIRNFRPIVLPDEAADGTTKDIELMLMLSPSKMNDNAPWYSVRVLSLQPDGTWADHVSGTIRVELEGESGNANNFGEEHKAAIEEAHEALERVTATAQEKMNMDTFYDERRAAGNDWGPSFALLTEGYIGKGCGLAKMKIPDIAECMPMGYFEPHLIHPTTLDASNHMLPAIFHREVINSPLMPFTTDESIFTSHLSSKPGDEMVIATELVPDGKTAARCNAWAFQPDESGQLRLVSSVRGLVLRAVGEDLDKNQIKPFDRKHNYQVFWNDDTDFLTQARYTELVDPFVARGSEVLDKLSTDEKAAAIYLQSVKDHSGVKDPDTAKLPHLSKYGRWISDYINSETCQGLIGSLSDVDKEAILEQSANSGIEGEGLACIGRNLNAILDDETSPLELLVANNILERIYADGPAKPLLNQMVEYVKLLVNKDPQMDILEVGAGTGSATKPFFAALGDDASDKIHKYHYTDISTSFFDTAKEHLEKWSNVLEYKTLDISKDPVDQGFDPKQQQYDVVIASNVLHATKSIHETLANVRMLLKPGGRLLLIEMERVETRILPTIFGTLPGWWEFNDGRKDSALLTNDEWDSELKAASFGGIEYVSPNCEKSRISLIIAKAVQEEPVDVFTPPSAVKVISSSASPIGVAASQALSSAFEKNGVSSSALTWDSFSTLEEEDASTLHIVLDSANSTILSKPDNEIFTRIQSVLVKSQSILWIMFHEEDKPDLNPIKALINGLARTLRREAEVIKMITLEVKDLIAQDGIESLVQNAVRVSQLLLTSEREHKPTDDEELVLEGGKVLIPRAYADKQFNDWTDRVNGRSPLAPHPFNDPNLPLRMEVGAPGLLSSIHFVQDDAPFIPLAPEEIRIDSKAFGVNFRDVFTALGQMGSSSLYMGECAGVVTEVGTGDFVQKTYKVGDRVMGIFASPFATKGTMSGYDCHVLPDNVSFNEGASILIIYSTVYYSFVNIARLEPGQSILIHAGSGGVGQAAIQLARHLGCTDEGIFVTVGSEEKKEFVMREYGIPESHILSSRSSPMDLKRKLMRMTNDRGVDVVLNSTSGEMLSESWECVAPFGYHIELGKSDIERKRHISMGPFSRNVTFSSLDMTIVSKQRPKIFYDVLDKTMKLFAQGILKPVRPLNVFPIDKLEASFRLISERKHLGKVILDLGDENTKVQAVLPPPPALKLRKDGSYIIAGGLGDIGRMLMKHLANLGAGHIITLSRRQLPDAERISLEDEVRALGGELHLEQCDITSNDSVQKLAQKCKESYPPVRGLVHAGMVLKDRPFVKMNSDEWNTVLGPKVFGTWHLDSAFKSPELDFFITLSSISGAVGNPGQSNYGAANAFQDAFVASHDRTHGTRYVSLDLPIVGATKAVTNLQSQNHDFQHKGGIVFNIDEIPQLMEYSMDSSIDLGRPFWHALMGFDRQSIAQGSGDYIWTAVYRTIPQLQASDAEVGSGGVKRDVEAMIRGADSFEDAVQIIAEMTHEKFIAFLNLDAEDVNMDQPLSSFGLDSLVSIELKNWMVRTFKVTLQAAELSNAPSMLHLAELLASRSKILPSTLAKKGQATEDKEDEPTEAKGGFQDASATEKVEAPNGTSEVVQRLECCPDPAHPLIQPVPNLKEALNDMIDSFVAMAESDEEIENLRTAVDEFVVPGGTAEKLHAETEALAASLPQGNWIREWLCNSSYLAMRQPIQYTSFMAVNHPSAIPHSQAERAALIIMEAYKFKREIDEDRVGPLFLADTPVCKAPLQYLYNTYRRPVKDRDVILKASENYCVVLRRGRMFVVPLQDTDFASLRATLASIITHVGDDQGTWAGILTTDNRDSWAERREELLAVSPGNAKYLQTLEQAAFTVNLDDGSPVGYTEHAKHGMLSSGFNRWFDKGVQLLIAENGNSGMIIEHSHIDGTTPETVYARLSEVIPAYKPTPLTIEAPVPEELTLVTSPEIDSHIAVLRERFADASAVRDYTSHILPTFTPHVLGAGGVSFKAGYDMLVQLALYFYWDRRILPNWAPIMHLHFHQGRHDVVQMMSPAVRAFCEAINASPRGENNSKKRALLLEAVKDINARVRKTRDGKGWLRTFAAIQRAWPKDEPATLWNDELWLRGFDFRAMSNINHPTTEAISTPLDASTLRLRYTIQDTQSIISLNCPVGSTDKIKRCVDEAAAIIEELCAVR